MIIKSHERLESLSYLYSQKICAQNSCIIMLKQIGVWS